MAHPRSRGENATHWAIAEIRAGSSPLTRGKLVGGETELSIPGLIPAHAGKTVGQGTPTVGHRAHPRSRGENPLHPDSQPLHAGSSPLTRGKRCRPVVKLSECGLIPAHAGKTSIMPAGMAVVRGSSPLTRGKPGARGARRAAVRLIPAHAGKTCSWFCPRVVSRAHPRSRGENRSGSQRRGASAGSSPLTRGKLEFTLAIHQCDGLIPAHAGKTTR